ncbi:hypothetical protein D8M04_06385 [Oceanobacillus piezotolerans]|uniref:Leucine-binding protein domain-containing protein n=1 Tax=Oceanobacillus piezotolerans TaxID=2448030 RepID=A0A498DAV2_9BACI|nr:ABC transporter substrate-binding protein [Oceanobacillus piezotolerans]RLL46824.1 hypothetical protein D8M04_06385 [Oceanobacillus piezotolerans]
MKTLNRLFVLLFVIVMLFFVTACAQNGTTVESSGQNDNSSNSSKYAQGVTDDEIIVGNSAPQTGPVADYDNVRKGMQAYFNHLNENGGINGREITLIAYDDEYQPSKTLQNMQRLIEEDKVFSLLGALGTANINASQSLLEESGVPVVGLATGANKFVEPPIPTFFATTFNYKIETNMMVHYTADKLDAKKVVLLYQNDDFGIDNLTYAKEALEEFPEIEIAEEIPFLASDVDFSSHTQKIIDADPDVILMFSTPSPAAHLRKEMYNRNLTEIPFFVNSNGGADMHQFEVAGEEVWEGIITTKYTAVDKSEVVDYDLYVERMKKDFSESDLGFLSEQGWSMAKIFAEGVKRSGDELTWENFLSQMNTFENWEETFYPSITYTPEHRYGNTTLFIVEAIDGNHSLLQRMHYDIETEKVTYE